MFLPALGPGNKLFHQPVPNDISFQYFSILVHSMQNLHCFFNSLIHFPKYHNICYSGKKKTESNYLVCQIKYTRLEWLNKQLVFVLVSPFYFNNISIPIHHYQCINRNRSIKWQDIYILRKLSVLSFLYNSFLSWCSLLVTTFTIKCNDPSITIALTILCELSKQAWWKGHNEKMNSVI